MHFLTEIMERLNRVLSRVPRKARPPLAAQISKVSKERLTEPQQNIQSLAGPDKRQKRLNTSRGNRILIALSPTILFQLKVACHLLKRNAF